MSITIHLDSSFRDLSSNPRSTEFKTYGNQASTWIKDRRISMVSADKRQSSHNPFYTVNILDLILPYIPIGSTVLTDEPFLFVDVIFEDGNQGSLINTNNPSISNIKFICEISNIQNNSLGAPIFIHYRALAEQTMLVNLHRHVGIAIYTKNGQLVNIVDPNIAATPYPINTTYTSTGGSVITLPSIAGILVGQRVAGPGIPLDTFVAIVGVPGPLDVTLTNAVSAVGTPTYVVFTPVITPSLQTYCVMELMPYQRDPSYEHLTEPK